MYRPKHKVSLLQRVRGLLGRREARAVAIVLAAAVAVAGLTLAGFRLGRGGVLPNFEVGGRAVGGMDEATLRRTIQRMATARRRAEVTIVRMPVAGVGSASFTTTPAAMGFDIDVDATVGSVLQRGRQLNPVSALMDHIRATFGPIPVPVVNRSDPSEFVTWTGKASRALLTHPREGSLTFDGPTVIPVQPRAGAGVDPDDLRRVVPIALGSPETDTVTVAGLAVPPMTTTDDVAAVAAQAEIALSRRVRLTRGEAAIVLTPKDLGRVLEVRPVTSQEVTTLELAVDPERLEDVAADDIPEIESQPVSATFRPAGTKIHLVPSKPGFGFDPVTAAAQVVDVAVSADRKARLQGRTVDANLTTKEARALHIKRLVSTFTTYHPCCEPRVHNIHRIADLIRGTILEPGKVYSVNGDIGIRTAEKGFVEAPGISDGKIVDQLGGGISQFATTMFNAIYFGGYDFVAFRAHSYYFSRYPMGREATLSWPSPDLAFRNDSAAGVYIATSYTETSITVSLYGDTDVKVESVTGAPYNVTPPETECEENPALAEGEKVTTQAGIDGFDVQVTRILNYPNAPSKTENYFTHYKPEPIIVQQRSCEDTDPTPSPSPSP